MAPIKTDEEPRTMFPKGRSALVTLLICHTDCLQTKIFSSFEEYVRRG